MNPLSIFPSGQELANLVVNSNLLNLSLAAISSTLEAEVNPSLFQQQQQSLCLKWRVYSQSNFVIVAFVTSPTCSVHHLQQDGGDMVSSATLKQDNFNLFDFLCSKPTPSFSINRAAFTLFYQHLQDLSHIKNLLVDLGGKLLVENPIIITGNSLGGSVASLFTLWMLDSINQPTKTKRPLCITFGSPLIGDLGLQKAVSECSSWNSCFLNVASNQDPFPSLFASQESGNLYRPFGAFLLCSQQGSTCVDDPDQVSLLLQTMGLQSRLTLIAEDHLLSYYGNLMDHLKSKLVLKGIPVLGSPAADPLQAGMVLQLEAIGYRTIQEPQHENLLMKLRVGEQRYRFNKRKTLDPSRKLNEVKIKMAYLEWYKKTCKAKKIGYYDGHKNHLCNNHLSPTDIDVTKHKRFLSKYWIEMVEEAEKKPQKEGAFIRMTWLLAGTNYRRMVEPLDIAEHYANGKRNYEVEGRSKHYVLLEKWQKESAERATDPPSKKKKQNVGGNLTEDSCFWAKVEEGIASWEVLKDEMSDGRAKESSKEYIIGLEQYVMEQIKNYAVSPEIFLPGSSFIKWWDGYKEIASNSILKDFMMNRRFVQYENGLTSKGFC
ncbi:senescence-associated gene 101 [Euphorbia peplus]|nr:senescence-associated gene 101 [Euphorbia peplus]